MSSREKLAERIREGYEKISERVRAGEDTSDWEDFWARLVREYEMLCAELDNED